MTKTFTAKITLSDSQYEALQVIYRLEAENLDEFISMALKDELDVFLAGVSPASSYYKRLEKMIEL